MGSGGRKPTISDRELLRECKLTPDPVFTAKEVGGRINMTRQGVNSRFDELVEAGYLNEKDVGSRAKVYWLTDEGKRAAAAVH